MAFRKVSAAVLFANLKRLSADHVLFGHDDIDFKEAPFILFEDDLPDLYDF